MPSERVFLKIAPQIKITCFIRNEHILQPLDFCNTGEYLLCVSGLFRDRIKGPFSLAKFACTSFLSFDGFVL